MDDDATSFARLFRAIYAEFHRRDGPRGGLTGASRAVLEHLAMAGPLTIGEMASHLDRAQSVVSEIVDQLEAKALLERERDPADRRRVLVWLTADGQAVRERDQEVLDVERLRAAFDRLDPPDATTCLATLRTLIEPTNTKEFNHD